jgi:hypothetical protein
MFRSRKRAKHCCNKVNQVADALNFECGIKLTENIEFSLVKVKKTYRMDETALKFFKESTPNMPFVQVCPEDIKVDQAYVNP